MSLIDYIESLTRDNLAAAMKAEAATDILRSLSLRLR